MASTRKTPQDGSTTKLVNAVMIRDPMTINAEATLLATAELMSSAR